MDTEEAGAREHMMDSSLLAYRVPDFLNALGSISHLSRLCPGPPLSQEQDHLWCHWYLETAPSCQRSPLPWLECRTGET